MDYISDKSDLSGKVEKSRISFRQNLSSFLLSAVRAYTYHTPINRGKYRLITLALRLCRGVPAPQIVTTKDGRQIKADLATGMHTFVYFLGDYEPTLTALTRLLVKEGDVCLDVGANFGWYTTLFAALVGASGTVHSFEPVPSSFEELRINCKLSGSPGNTFINDFALTDKKGSATINLFPGLTTGHASLSQQGRNDADEFICSTDTLDAYLTERNVKSVDFVKVDIEGAELAFLKGAAPLFCQQRPPLILMEMAVNTTSNFGYHPNDLIDFIRSAADYSFFVIDEAHRSLVQIEQFERDDPGANVLCIPSSRSYAFDRLSAWLGRVDH
jgi:FkbM family methyltransferase